MRQASTLLFVQKIILYGNKLNVIFHSTRNEFFFNGDQFSFPSKPLIVKFIEFGFLFSFFASTYIRFNSIELLTSITTKNAFMFCSIQTLKLFSIFTHFAYIHCRWHIQGKIDYKYFQLNFYILSAFTFRTCLVV